MSIWQLRCMDCDHPILSGGIQYGKKVKCCDCHSSYRFCRDNVAGWHNMTAAERRQWILSNKGKGGRGKKRRLESVTSVVVTDFNQRTDDAAYLNEIRLGTHARY